MRKQSVLSRCLFALGLFVCLGVLLFTPSGCGGNSSGQITTTVTSVAVSPATQTVTAGKTAKFSVIVSGNGSPSQVCTWSVSPTSAGTITTKTANAVFTASSSITSATKVTITATSTVPGYTNMAGTAAATVNPVAVTITSVTVTPATKTLTAGESATFTAAVAGTGAFSSAVTWSVSPTTAGTITADGVFTASSSIAASTNATVTAASAVSGYTNITGSAAVTINPPPLPDITAISPTTVYEEDPTVFATVTLTASDAFPSTGIIHSNCPVIFSGTLLSPTKAALKLEFDNENWTPGSCDFRVCTDDTLTNCGKPQAMAFVGGQNELAVSSSGELFFLDQGTDAATGKIGYVRKYASDGTPEKGFPIGGFVHCIAVDGKTGYVILDGFPVHQDGSDTFIFPQGYASVPATGCAADNGFAGFVQPSNNSATFYDLTGGDNSSPTVHIASNLGNHPAAIAMSTPGTDTEAVIFSVDGTPSLYKRRVADAFKEGSALPVPGCTSLSKIQAAKPSLGAGGWSVLMFDSGTDVAFCAYDKLLVFVDHSTWTIMKSIPLGNVKGVPASAVPSNIAPDPTNAAVIVAYTVPGATATTSYVSVDLATGTPTALANVSSKVSVGLLVKAGGKVIYSGQRNELELLQNK